MTRAVLSDAVQVPVSVAVFRSQTKTDSFAGAKALPAPLLDLFLPAEASSLSAFGDEGSQMMLAFAVHIWPKVFECSNFL